jgi:hypothetical protein
MVRHFRLTIALVLVAASSALAQNSATPDLSGTWVFSPTKSKLPEYVHIGSQKIAITCSGKAIRFHITTDGKESIVTYMADGKDHSRLEPEGEAYSKVQWKDSVLIVESGVYDSPAEHNPGFNQYWAQQMAGSRSYSGSQPMMATGAAPAKQRWSLSPDGRVLNHAWVGYTRPGTNVASDLTFVYDKQ